MSTHTRHANISEDGLASECERCTEISHDPFRWLDEPNLVALIERTRAWMNDAQFPRTDAESRAMRLVEEHLIRQRLIDRAFAAVTGGCAANS